MSVLLRVINRVLRCLQTMSSKVQNWTDGQSPGECVGWSFDSGDRVALIDIEQSRHGGHNRRRLRDGIGETVTLSADGARHQTSAGGARSLAWELTELDVSQHVGMARHQWAASMRRISSCPQRPRAGKLPAGV
jgi:hypothetical protein